MRHSVWAASLVACTAALYTTGAVGAESAQDRWNLADLYPTRAAWEADAVRLKTQIDDFASCRGRLAQSAASLKSCLERRSELWRRYGRLAVYGSETHNQDTGDAAGLELEQRIHLLRAQFGEASAFFSPEILEAGPQRIAALLAEDRSLAPYRRELDEILRSAPHTLDAGREGLVAAFGPVTDIARSSYTLLTTAEMPWPTITLADGTSVTLDQAAYTKYRAVPDRADRRRVMAAFFGQMKQFERVLGSTLYGQMKIDSVEAKVRRYPDAIAAALDEDAVPVAVYDTLIRETHAHLDTLHRYFRLRAKLLGVGDLHYYDIYPPLVQVDRRYDLADAKRLTLEAVAPLGAAYVAAMRAGFDQRWMDAYPRPRKLSGAHMSGGAYDVHPYVLLNYNGDYESLTTLAHEWGHALHTVEANRAQPFQTAHYPIFVAEIASTFNEALLLRHLLDIAKDDDERLLYLGSALEGLRGTFFRQAMFAEFEREVHARVDRGEPLGGPELSKLYGELLRQYHGDAVTIDPVDTIEWAYIPHFYNAFYVYQYATSIAASSLFADRVLAQEPGALERYLGLLRAGGSGAPYELVRQAGVDLAEAAPYRSIAVRMDRIMDEIEAIQARRARRTP